MRARRCKPRRGSDQFLVDGRRAPIIVHSTISSTSSWPAFRASVPDNHSASIISRDVEILIKEFDASFPEVHDVRLLGNDVAFVLVNAVFDGFPEPLQADEDCIRADEAAILLTLANQQWRRDAI